MSDLTTFLLARIEEDEAVAKAAADASADGPVWPDAPWCASVSGDQYGDSQNVEFYYARVLAECEAKRQIVERAQDDMDLYRYAREVINPVDPDDWTRGAVWALEFALKQLALPYAGHPDYQDEWRP